MFDTITVGISIHALHEESDTVAVCESAVRQVISIHALHEESDGVVQSSAFDR